MVVVFPKANLYQVPVRQAQDLNREIGVFHDALNKVRQDMRDIHERLAGKVAEEERQLFDVYLHMLDDDALGKEVLERIQTGIGPRAHSLVALEHIRSFEMMPDDYLRERAVDIKDLCSRVCFICSKESRYTRSILKILFW